MLAEIRQENKEARREGQLEAFFLVYEKIMEGSSSNQIAEDVLEWMDELNGRPFWNKESQEWDLEL
jgi:hypothetical protein